MNPENKREKTLVITSKGQGVVRSTHQKVDSIMSTSLNHFSPKETEELTLGLKRYARAINRAILQNKVVIRKAISKDDKALAALIREALREHGELKPGTIAFDPQVEHLSKYLNGSRSIYYVAELNGEVLGGCGIGPTKSLPKHTAELKRMFLKPEARGLGLGKTLMDLCIEFARKNNFTECYLETLEGLVVARKFYETEGFKYLKKTMGDTGHFACHQYCMLKKL